MHIHTHTHIYIYVYSVPLFSKVPQGFSFFTAPLAQHLQCRGKVKASVRCLRLEVESLAESAEGKDQESLTDRRGNGWDRLSKYLLRKCLEYNLLHFGGFFVPSQPVFGSLGTIYGWLFFKSLRIRHHCLRIVTTMMRVWFFNPLIIMPQWDWIPRAVEIVQLPFGKWT